MDALEKARTVERIQRIRIAVINPACLRNPVTAGLESAS
jgi:hypothetical protein